MNALLCQRAPWNFHQSLSSWRSGAGDSVGVTGVEAVRYLKSMMSMSMSMSMCFILRLLVLRLLVKII